MQERSLIPRYGSFFGFSHRQYRRSRQVTALLPDKTICLPIPTPKPKLIIAFARLGGAKCKDVYIKFTVIDSYQ
jgi:hypothetical protein